MKNKFSRFIFNRFRKNEIKLHELTYLFWECTRRCNLKCLHCGSDCSADSNAADMPFDDFLKAILPLQKKYNSAKVTVAITGGEPILRPDLPECGSILRKHGFHWGIVTNGYAYTHDIHSRLLAAGMGSLTLSLDGLESTHNWLRGNNQSFDRALKALDLISSSNKLSYDIVTCVNPRNIEELEQMKELLIARKTMAWRLTTISPIGRATGSDEMRLSPDQLKQMMDFIVSSRADKRMHINYSCEAYVGDYETKVRDYYFFCRAGNNIASVLIDGSISACPNINRSFVQGNIYNDDFMDVWNNRYQIFRNRSWAKQGECTVCKYFKYCKGNGMHMRDESGNLLFCHFNRLKEAES
jgi:radical SAM enzyme (rSAM/lipoprotein system)